MNQSPVFADAMLAWYDKNARALPWRLPPVHKKAGKQPNPYFVWMSEIMLQQTTVATVGRYFIDFTTRWPTVSELAAAPIEDVLGAWAGLGYYRRAHNLHKCATLVAEEYRGVFPIDAKGLLELPGIGPYTSAAIAAICFDEPIAVIDGNVERVAARQLDLALPPKQAMDDVRGWLEPLVPNRSGDFAQSLMDLGATICTPKKPNCAACPVQHSCRSLVHATQALRPVKPQKKARPEKQAQIFVVQNQQGDVWLRTRPAQGLLAQMPEFPSTDWQEHAAPFSPPFNANWTDCGAISHIFTHFKLDLQVHHTRIADEQPFEQGDWQVVSGATRSRLPTLFKKVWDAALIR